MEKEVKNTILSLINKKTTLQHLDTRIFYFYSYKKYLRKTLNLLYFHDINIRSFNVEEKKLIKLASDLTLENDKNSLRLKSKYGLKNRIYKKKREIDSSVILNVDDLVLNKSKWHKLKNELERVVSIKISSLNAKHYVHTPKFTWLKKNISKPIKGSVQQVNTYRRKNSGINIIANENIVRSIAPGIVVFSGFLKPMGNTVIIKHSNNYFSVYGKLKKISVTVDSYVDKSSIISSAVIKKVIYFELRKGMTILNSMQWLGY